MDMKEPCSNTHPKGENLLLLSVTGMEGVQRCQLSEIRQKTERIPLSPDPAHDMLIFFFFFFNVSYPQLVLVWTCVG